MIDAVKLDAEDGEFRATLIENGETREFEDKESFEAYVKEHPELKFCIESFLNKTGEDEAPRDGEGKSAE